LIKKHIDADLAQFDLKVRFAGLLDWIFWIYCHSRVVLNLFTDNEPEAADSTTNAPDAAIFTGNDRNHPHSRNTASNPYANAAKLRFHQTGPDECLLLIITVSAGIKFGLEAG
jgi:hypothetical protein